MGSAEQPDDVLAQCDDALRPKVEALLAELAKAKRHAERLDRLRRFEHEIDAIEGKQALFDRVAVCVRELFDVRRASVTLMNESGSTFDVFTLEHDSTGISMAGSALPLESTAVGMVLERGDIVNTSDITGSDFTDYRSLHEAGVRSVLHAPLSIGAHTIGSVNMGSEHVAAFGPVDEEIMRQLMRAVTRRLEARRLVSEAQSVSKENREAVVVVDRLRRLNEIAHELKSSMSEGEALSVLARLLVGVVPFGRGQIILRDRVGGRRRVFSLRPGRVTPTESGNESPTHRLDADFRSVVEARLFVDQADIGLIRLEHENLQRYTNRDLQLLNQTTSLVAATVHNIRLIEEAKEAQSAAESASAAKTTFVANISREIRTPLNSIIGMTSLLSRAELGAKHRQFVDTIRSSSESLLAVVSEVLDFTKIEADTVELEEEPFELLAFIEEVVGSFANRAVSNGLTIEHELADSLPRVVIGDPTRLRQILTSLIDNAMKFTPAGTVRIVVTKLDEAEILEDPEIHFTVVDQGIGMTPEHAASLFEPALGGEGSAGRRYGGAGMGLTIARRLVDLMGGQIWVESEPSHGSEFHFTACLRADRRVLVEAAQSTPGALPSDLQFAEDYPLHILVAEDNKVNQFVMLNILERLGYRADVAADGIEVLEALDRQPYDVILMDMQMPQMDGLTAATRIRQGHGADGQPQIIAVTANATQDDCRACIRAGMNDYLSKPVLIEDLVKALALAANRMTAANL